MINFLGLFLLLWPEDILKEINEHVGKGMLVAIIILTIFALVLPLIFRFLNWWFSPLAKVKFIIVFILVFEIIFLGIFRLTLFLLNSFSHVFYLGAMQTCGLKDFFSIVYS